MIYVHKCAEVGKKTVAHFTILVPVYLGFTGGAEQTLANTPTVCVDWQRQLSHHQIICPAYAISSDRENDTICDVSFWTYYNRAWTSAR